MRRLLADYGLFFREFLRTFHTTGAVLPSSPGLGRALATHVAGDGRQRRILEVGPGTGAVTRWIVRYLQPDDRLDLVEVNDRFVARLRTRFETDPAFVTAADRTEIVHDRVENLPKEPVYDVVVSGLPLNNFSVGGVQAVLATVRDCLKPDGVFSFFQYIGVRRLRAVFAGAEQRTRLAGIGDVLGEMLKSHEIRRNSVWINVPPAWVHHVRFNSTPDGAQGG